MTAEEVRAFLDGGDPALRWQVLRDLDRAAPERVAAERARVPREGWGARLLAEQAADGLWDGGVYRPAWAPADRPMFDAWTATHFALQQLAEFDPDPDDPAVRRAVRRVADGVTWERGEPYFDGETEPCVNGAVVGIAAWCGRDCTPAVRTLLRTQRPDGGWNCQADSPVSSLHSTICAVEGLLAWERSAGDGTVTRARNRGEEYLLQRRLLFRRTTGEPVDPRFAMLAHPARWYYDYLRALDHFRRADLRDPRLADAVHLLRASRHADGLWRLELDHEGAVLFRMEGEAEGAPSRWITLKALRVLAWWGG